MNSTILIADDDPVQRRLLEAMVRRFGFEAETVESGEQALDRLRRHVALDDVAGDLGRVARRDVIADAAGRPVRSTIGIVRDRHVSTMFA